jgi:hypothetical protein
MRTVKLEMHMPGPHDRAPTMVFATEVVVDENEAQEAGIAAGKFLMEFSEGVASWGGDDDE